jgi:hypothetical protein
MLAPVLGLVAIEFVGIWQLHLKEKNIAD